MKKIIAFIMTFLMIFALCSCGSSEGDKEASSSKSAEASPAAAPEATKTPAPEPTEVPEVTKAPEPEKEPELPDAPAPEEKYEGEWYGSLHGLTMCLDLHEDDSYTVSMSALQEEPGGGSWALNEGYIYMDNEEQPSIFIIGEELFWSTPGIYLTKEKQEAYTPAPVSGEVNSGDFDGYWKSVYVDMDGAVVFADSVGDDTDIYIEGTEVALGGSLFGDVYMDFTFENGSLILSEGEGEKAVAVTIQLQEDALMRVTLDANGEKIVIILEAAEVPWEISA